ncbi:MAG: YebC/PmpR family DNA-binding transcriptional regulator, partial [Patescibacteria group bacterium]
ELELSLIDQGILDFSKEAEGITVYTEIRDLQKIKDFLAAQGLKADSAEIEYVAKEKITVNAEEQTKFDKFFEELDGNEDVSDYYSNLL